MEERRFDPSSNFDLPVGPGLSRPECGEAVLRDAVLDRTLLQDGFVKVPLVGPHLLRAAEQEYRSLVPDGEGAIQLDYLRQDRRLVRRLADLADTLWKDAVPAAFIHHYPVYSSFVAKYPGTDSSLFLHRDLCVDDERFRRAFVMWMPFVDTSPVLDNGPLSIVPESHQIHHGTFGPNAAVLFEPYSESLQEQLQPISVRAGHGLLYDARTLHASTPNNSSMTRMAVVCLLAAKDQPVIQVLSTGRRGREVRQVDRDFFIELTPSQIATGGIPDRYPVIDMFEEEPATSAKDVLPPQLRRGAERRVPIPVDQRGFVRGQATLEVRHSRMSGLDHDLRISSSHPMFKCGQTSHAVSVKGEGGVGAHELVRRWRRANELPDELDGIELQLRSLFTTCDATVVVVDPMGRVELTFPGGRLRRSEVTVLDCPPVMAGVVLGGRVAEAEPGMAVPSMLGEPMRWWNEGPGPLVLLVRRGWFKCGIEGRETSDPPRSRLRPL